MFPVLFDHGFAEAREHRFQILMITQVVPVLIRVRHEHMLRRKEFCFFNTCARLLDYVA
jgi:hypothetical protein